MVAAFSSAIRECRSKPFAIGNSSVAVTRKSKCSAGRMQQPQSCSSSVAAKLAPTRHSRPTTRHCAVSRYHWFSGRVSAEFGVSRLQMRFIAVQVTRYVDDPFPGWVECIMVDASSQKHLFVEKVPIVTSENLGPESAYPQDAVIACEVEKEWSDEAGRSLALVNTELPSGIESTSGVTKFVVLQAQLVTDAPDA